MNMHPEGTVLHTDSVQDNGTANSNCVHAGAGRAPARTATCTSWCQIWVHVLHGDYGEFVQVACVTLGLPTATACVRGTDGSAQTSTGMGTSWRKIWVHGEKGDLVQVVYGTMGLPTATVRMRGAEEPGSARARALHGARFGFTRNTVTWYRWCMGQWGCRQRLCACGGRESLGQHGQGCFMVQDLGSRGIRWPCVGSVWDNGAADSDCAHAGGGRAWVSTGKGASWCKIWVHGEYGGLV